MSSRFQQWHKDLGALWLSSVFTLMGFYFFLPFIPLYLRDLGVTGLAETAQWAGAITAAGAVSMAFAQPVIGHLADRLGPKPVIIFCKLATGAVIIGMGFVNSPEQLLAVRFIQGMVMGSTPAINSLLMSSSPKDRVGFSLGIIQTSQALGTSLGPMIGGLIADTLGYRAAFSAAGLLVLLSGIVVVFMVRNEPPSVPVSSSSSGIISQSRALLRIPQFPTVLSVIFLIQFGTVVVMPILTLFVAELQGDANAATVSGLLLGATGMATALSAVVVARLGDRIGHAVILPICLVGAAACYVPQAFVQEVWQLLCLRVLLGLLLGAMVPSANVLLAQIVPKHRRGAAFGLGGTAFAAANMLGPTAGSQVAAFFGLRAVFLATAGVFASTYLLLATRGRDRRDAGTQEAYKTTG